MAKGGYVGKILYVNLTDKSIEEIPTEQYEEWGGGLGIGSAIFFERVKDKSIDGFDPDNLVSIMTSPLSGTLAPSASGRTELCGIGSQAYPTPWFTRSNFGGRFAGMIKFAGWDGVVVQGKSESPVWINIVNDKVTIEDAAGLWGLDTYETQEEVWSIVTGQPDVREWWALGGARDGGRTTQKPAVMAIGPAGENLNRNANIMHDSGNAAGQGGFGAIFGSKNLKAISVIGTGSVPVADPAALMQLRQEIVDKFAYHPDEPVLESPTSMVPMYGIMTQQPGYATLLWAPPGGARPQGCMGCYRNCRMNHEDGMANGDICVEGLYWMASGDVSEQNKATNLLDRMGINVYDVFAHDYLLGLYKKGILGPGKQIHSELPWDKYDTYEFIEAYTKAIAYGTDIGADLKDGLTRAVVKWGLWDEHTSDGSLTRPQWGFMEHYDPRLEVEWSYGSLFGDRDINEHDYNWHIHWMPLVTGAVGQEPLISAEDMVNELAKATGLKPEAWDYSAEGIYTDDKLSAVEWHRYYTRFWKQSALYCDWAWPNLINYNSDDKTGASPTYEPALYKAVTGNDITMEKGLEIGQRIWNLHRAIWVLQGRHREQEVFTNYVYDVPTSAPYPLTVKQDGAWTYDICVGRTLDRAKFEDVKDRFYKRMGWDVATGWPTKSGLESLGLGFAASELAKADKLGG